MPSDLLDPIVLEPTFVPRVWGSPRFGNPNELIGEVWVVHEDNLIRNGPGAGTTLKDAVVVFGEQILGSSTLVQGDRSFPLLIKLIEAASWLSIQVHPTDELAELLEGEGFRGKTEAWYVIDAEPDSRIIAGATPGVGQDDLRRAIQDGSVRDLLQTHTVAAGDTVYLPAGTVHALGPGAFIYEVQQSSDITYRVYDWDRPAADGRALHLDQSIRAARADIPCIPQHHSLPAMGKRQNLLASEYFRLDRVQSSEQPITMATDGASFHCLTALSGSNSLNSAYWRHELGTLESVIIPADSGAYEVSGNGMVLVASVPDPD